MNAVFVDTGGWMACADRADPAYVGCRDDRCLRTRQYASDELVVGILRHARHQDVNPMRTWSTEAGDVRNDPAIAAELADWLRSQGIRDTFNYDRIIGCPRGRSSAFERPHAF